MQAGLMGIETYLDERPASRGELRRFAERFGAAALIDREHPRFRALGLHVSGDSPQRLLDRALTEPRLLRTPLVRGGQRVSIGTSPTSGSAGSSEIDLASAAPTAEVMRPTPGR